MSIAARKASTAYAIERTTGIMLKHYEQLVADSAPRKSSWSVRLRKLLEKVTQ
jgi:hypothetical protein